MHYKSSETNANQGTDSDLRSTIDHAITRPISRRLPINHLCDLAISRCASGQVISDPTRLSLLFLSVCHSVAALSQVYETRHTSCDVGCRSDDLETGQVILAGPDSIVVRCARCLVYALFLDPKLSNAVTFLISGLGNHAFTLRRG